MAALSEDPATWAGQHFVSVTQLSRPALDMVLAEAARMKALVQEKGACDTCADRSIDRSID